MKKCPVCGVNLDNFWKKEDIKIYICSNCGLGITDGGILQKSKYHRDDVYLKEEDFFSNIFLKRVNLISKLIKPGKVLEVGCSTGLMLKLLEEKGWIVKGVEISKKAAEVARSKGIEVMGQYFEKVIFKEKFNLIILNHTLEHMKSPDEVIKKAKNILIKGGMLYIDLPNFGGLSAKVYQASWSLLLPEEHLWHFTEKSLKMLLSKNGFEVISSHKSSGIWNSNNPTKEVWLSLVGLKKRFFNEIVTALPSLVLSKIGQGSDLMVVSRKM